MENISNAIMLCCEALGYGHPSCEKIDLAENDDDIKAGLKECVKALKALGKSSTAEQVKKLTTGFINWK